MYREAKTVVGKIRTRTTRDSDQSHFTRGSRSYGYGSGKSINNASDNIIPELSNFTDPNP